ncbi:glycosyl hydrolase family 8 [Nocardioides marmoraquaticus]
MRAPRPAFLVGAVLVASVLVAGTLAVLVTRDPGPSPAGQPGSTPLPSSTTAIDATDFLDAYVDDDGRVVRRDQGGDTVSEGQAYAMLVALVARDQERFDRVWRWTQDNLRRDDGLFSWRWQDGQVVDPSSASDAEVDVARALVVAADVFGDAAYRQQGIEVGDALLDHETVEVPDGRLLVAGQWATQAPYRFNPSYVSPATTTLLGEASGDPRWAELERGSRAAVQALVADGSLPPNWAEVDEDGSVRAVPSPDGTAPQYGYDAARTLLRHAESCVPADRAIAAGAARTIGRDGRAPVAAHDLAGSPQTDVASPLATVAQAAGLAAAGDGTGARELVVRGGEQQQEAPTYYGDAWTVLGPALLEDPDLGGCPLLGGDR